MSEHRVCPHCGYDLIKDYPIVLNDFAMLDNYSPLYYRGNPVKLTPAMRSVCWAMMKAFPRSVSHDVLLERLGSESESNVVDVYLSKIRTELRRIGAPVPFEAIRARKVIWKLST